MHTFEGKGIDLGGRTGVRCQTHWHFNGDVSGGALIAGYDRSTGNGVTIAATPEDIVSAALWALERIAEQARDEGVGVDREVPRAICGAAMLREIATLRTSIGLLAPWSDKRIGAE